MDHQASGLGGVCLRCSLCQERKIKSGPDSQESDAHGGTPLTRKQLSMLNQAPQWLYVSSLQ
ncbi:hypothetical protein HispidOSU_028616 [Sigmodon hispidus]